MIYKSEIYRAIHNKRFVISLTVALLIVLVHILVFVVPVVKYLDLYKNYPTLMPHSLYNKWIGLFPFYTSIAFYWLIPILAAFPFVGSYITDRKRGYMKNILVRTEKRKYLRAKALAVFVSSAILVAVPLLLDLLVTAAFIPALNPQPSTNTFVLADGFMWSRLFYHVPLVYVLLYIALDAVFISVSVMLSLAVSNVLRHSLEAVLLPFLIYLCTYYVFAWTDLSWLAPLSFLLPMQPTYHINLVTILAELLLAAGAVYLFYYRRGIRKDISL